MFVIFSLLTLLAAPMLLERRIADVRSGVLEPGQEARAAVNELRQALSESEAAYRGYLLTGDPRLRATMQRADAEAGRLVQALRVYSGDRDTALASSVEVLAARAGAARARRYAAPEPSDTIVAVAVRAHESLVSESDRLRLDIIADVEQARTRIRRLERTGVLVMLGLGFLALAASLVVIGVAARDRRTAGREAELREAALSLALATQVQDTLARIAASAARTVEGASSFVERIEEDESSVAVVASAGAHVLPEGTHLPYPGSLTQAAIHSGTPEQFRVAAMAPRPSAALLRTACADCSGIVLPLIADGAPQGALVLLRTGHRDFRPREIERLRTFAVFAALALRKAVLLARAVEQQQQVEDMARVRERMVRGFSHDLKNPVGAADGHAALLEDGILGELNARQQKHVERIRSSLRGALEIIDDVVELARAESGRLVVRRTPLDASQLVRDLCGEYGAAASAAGLQLEASVDEPLPSVLTDPRRVHQVLGNLLSNAIKYTPDGGRLCIRATLQQGRRSSDPREWLTFAVSDTGPGIAPEDIPRLFQEFQRLDDGAAGGAGIGLAISDRVARLLGGKLKVQSEPGGGSTFTLWLPVERGGGNPHT